MAKHRSHETKTVSGTVTEVTGGFWRAPDATLPESTGFVNDTAASTRRELNKDGQIGQDYFEIIILNILNILRILVKQEIPRRPADLREGSRSAGWGLRAPSWRCLWLGLAREQRVRGG